ncbi:MAG: pilus assembly protein [Chloroflexi bacterium]|nr:pilus assembly protein [Chloroflexota bacterium]MBU1748487.1 pilus assembly protein [Chloroflexota bacterium]MBU1878114.1 pilus assembly protein [Chloroflexota bacterium]
MKRRIMHRLHQEHGVELVEAAVTLPIVFLLFLVIVQFGWTVYAQQTVQEAARYGVRRGVVAQNNPGGVARVEALGFTTNAGLGGATAQVLAPGGVVGSNLRLRITYQPPNLLAWMGLPQLTVRGEAEGRMEGW